VLRPKTTLARRGRQRAPPGHPGLGGRRGARAKSPRPHHGAKSRPTCHRGLESLPIVRTGESGRRREERRDLSKGLSRSREGVGGSSCSDATNNRAYGGRWRRLSGARREGRTQHAGPVKRAERRLGGPPKEGGAVTAEPQPTNCGEGSGAPRRRGRFGRSVTQPTWRRKWRILKPCLIPVTALGQQA